MKKQAVCEGCSKIFERDHWRIRQDRPNYCSRQCGCRYVGGKSTPPWNKGILPNDPLMMKLQAKRSLTLKQKYESGDLSVWNKGLTKETNASLASASRKQSKIRSTEGEWKENWKKSLSKGQVAAHAAGKYPKTFTKPEQLTWAHLESLGYTVKKFSDKTDADPPGIWYNSYPLDGVFVPDFACPDKKQIIECNGCYVHGHFLDKCSKPSAKTGQSSFSERNAKRDRKKFHFYNKNGWKYAIVWECEAEKGDFHRLEKYL